MSFGKISRLAARTAGLMLCLCWFNIAAAGADAGNVQLVSAPELAEVLKLHRGRVVVLNFWATWCSPCVREVPELMQLEADLGPSGLSLVTVSLDDPAQQQSVVEPFIERWFAEFETLISSERAMDTMVSVVDNAWNEVLPTTYILGRDGAVVTRIQGGSSAEEFATAIRPLL